jgi:hypothetical protein
MNRLAAGGFLCVGFLLLGAPPALAQNQLTNGSFATNLTGWPAESAAATTAFSTNDANGSGASGSIAISNVSSGANNGAGVSQCVNGITGGASYDYLGKAFIPTGQDRTGTAQIGLRWYAAASCAGGTVGNQPRQSTATVGSWVALSGLSSVAPANAVSAQFVAFPSKVEEGGTLVANFDDLILRPAGTPVSLVSFDGE